MEFDKQFVIDELKKQGQSQQVQKALTSCQRRSITGGRTPPFSRS